jgi:uncharacterized protein (UPF0332 family)
MSVFQLQALLLNCNLRQKKHKVIFSALWHYHIEFAQELIQVMCIAHLAKRCQ